MEWGCDNELFGLYHMIRFGTFLCTCPMACCPWADEFATGTVLHSGASACLVILDLRTVFTICYRDSRSRFPIPDTAMSVLSEALAALRLAVAGTCSTAGDAMLSLCAFVIAIAASD